MNRWDTRIAGASLVLVLASCHSPGVSTRKELRFAIAGDPKTFDPLQSSDSDSETIRYLTAGVLVRINRVTDALEPELAESWEWKDGGRAIFFHLREGLKFSDSSPLTADDIARTLNRALDPKQASPTGDTFRAADGNPEITVTSPRDISIRYKSFKAGLDRLFDELAIMPSGPPDLGKFPVTSGPYFVAEHLPGEYVRLARNSHYWKHDTSGRQLPYIDSVRIDIQQNRDIELTRFLRGELNLIDRIEPSNFDRIVKEKSTAARDVGPSLDPEFLWFNQSPAKTLPEYKRKWFTSTVFRNAVSAAIHREDMVRIVFHGYAHAAPGPISPANHFWFDSSLKPFTDDPQGALKSLAAEGFFEHDGVLRDRDGHPVEFSLVTQAGKPTREKMASLVQDDLGKLGIKVNIVTLDIGSVLDRIAKTLDYEAVLLGTHAEIDPMEEMNFWLSSGPQHFWWPKEKSPATPWEARIDELELKQATEASRDERKKLIDEFQKIVVTQQPVIYLVYPDFLCAISPSLRSVRPAVVPPQLLWNVEWLSLE
jgi:peptide/nickel transport system substrate-binding protein